MLDEREYELRRYGAAAGRRLAAPYAQCPRGAFTRSAQGPAPPHLPRVRYGASACCRLSPTLFTPESHPPAQQACRQYRKEWHSLRD